MIAPTPLLGIRAQLPQLRQIAHAMTQRQVPVMPAGKFEAVALALLALEVADGEVVDVATG